MILYHGSYLEIKVPRLDLGRANLDFGRGFYVTAIKEQSEKWAMRRTAASKILNGITEIQPIVSVYDFSSQNLKQLSFDGYSEQWLDFVVRNRNAKEEWFDSGYDVVYGNVADDDVARAVDDYMDLLIKGRVNKDVKNALLYQLQFSKPNDQYCFLTDRAMQALTYVRSYEMKVK